jgi:hypothetical protein
MSSVLRAGRVAVAIGVVVAAVAVIPAAAAHFITSGDIKDGAVHARDIAKGAVTYNRLSPGVRRLVSRTSANSQNGAPGSQGAQGPKGDQGPRGADGAPGANGLDSDQPRTVTASSLLGFVPAPKGDNGSPTDNGTVSFTTPPAAPNLGTKSLELVTTNGKPVVMYAPLLPGTEKPLLAELTKASYESLVKTSPGPGQDVSFQMEVIHSSSTKFTSGYTTVVYEPYQNGTPDEVNVWHRHSFDNGRVWSSSHSTQPSPPSECIQSNPCPFRTFVEQNPNAVVLTAKFRVGQNSGVGAAGLDAFVDDFSYGFGPVTRYDIGG